MDNDKPLIDQVPKVAFFAAGAWLGYQDAQAKAAYKAAGLKRPISDRIFSFVMNVLGIVIGGPILLAIAALTLYAVGGALYFGTLVILNLLGLI